MPKPSLRLRVYPILEAAVEIGVAAGLRHAYKHRDDYLPPDAVDAILEHVVRDVMAELADRIDLDATDSGNISAAGGGRGG